MRLAAHAKVNLFLRVVGRRPDGYHELETVFQSVSLCDDVILETTKEPWDPARIALTCDDPAVPADARNLVWRAASALAERAGERRLRGVRVALTKRIPAGGGLGGGSSDAAVVLVGLRRLWSLEMPDAALAEIAVGLGADVPFFLMGGTALGTGRGEVLTPLPPLLPLDLVLATPAFGVDTAWAYAARREPAADAPSLEAFREAMRVGTPAVLARVLRNDLEGGVIARHPEVEVLRRELVDAGALGARMTGSGSTVFAVATDAAHAQRLAAAVAHPDRRLAAVRTLTAEAARPG